MSAPKADALPGCATPRTAEALRFPAAEGQAESEVHRNALQNIAATSGASPEIVPNGSSAFWDMVDIRGEDECWPWLGGCDRDGYGQLKRNGGVVIASRVALAEATGKMRYDLHALHSCDNPPCCNPGHLRWGTPADNAQDKMLRGRGRTGDQVGANNGAAKLSEKQVELVVERLHAGWGNSQIAADLPVGHSMISLIRLGRMWGETTKRMGWEPRPTFRRRTSGPCLPKTGDSVERRGKPCICWRCAAERARNITGISGRNTGAAPGEART